MSMPAWPAVRNAERRAQAGGTPVGEGQSDRWRLGAAREEYSRLAHRARLAG